MTFNTEHEATLMIHTFPPPPAKITQSPLFLASSPSSFPLSFTTGETRFMRWPGLTPTRPKKPTIVSKLNADRQPGFSVVVSGGNL